MADRDYSKRDVCGADLGPDKIHIMIDNGRVARHTYCCLSGRQRSVESPMNEPTCSSCKGVWTPTHQCVTGADLKAERLVTDLSQAEVSQRMGVSPARIWNVENGYCSPGHPGTLSAEFVERYRKALGEA
jgi:hypothetical protein